MTSAPPPLRCLLLDDEPIARQVLRTYAERLPFLQVVGEAANALEAQNFLREEPVDLLFCDVEMPRISGLEFLRVLPRRPLVVLVTAHEQYALAGFELDVVDYLLKPVAFERFWRAAEKARDQWLLQQWKQQPPVPAAVPAAPPAAREPGFIMLKADGQLVKVELPSIRYVEAMKDYVKIFTTQRRLVVYLTLKKLEESLPASEFTRVHKSYLVRNDHMQALQGNILTLDSQVQIPVGLQFRAAVLQVMQRHLLQR